ncbi:MAG: PLP-dependent aspartate aminotransferase family protein [Pirellulales bacterium]|nr:PLP-dependent aspartate aminotransferase family protein [Pirellulales bacterium]
MQFRTRAIHVGQSRDPATGAVVPPVYLATTYVQHAAGEWREFDYARSGNPTRKAFETTLADLEGGVGGLAMASGMAATHAVTMLLERGDHIVAASDIYGGTYRLLHKIVNRAGIDVTLAPATDLDALRRAFTPRTKLLWVETPGNPLLSICDLAACADIAHRAGAILAADNTFASPALTRPLESGADIVMHSATKYIGGHSDVLGGALVVRDPQLYDRLYFIQNATGAVLSPLDSYLMSRGLKTLELRMREHCRSAGRIAEHLAAHPLVRRVYYPGLASHPGHELAARQMHGGFGAMLSFEVAGDFAAAKRVCESTRLFQLAVSLGAVESLIEQPAAMSHASYDPADRLAHGIRDELVRLSIGLEAPEDLIADLDQALAQIR